MNLKKIKNLPKIKREGFLDKSLRLSFFIYLVCASPFFFFPRPETQWVALFSFGFIFYHFFFSPKIEGRSPLDLVILVFVIFLFINLLILPDLVFSLPKVMGAFYGLLVFYCLMGIIKTRKIAFLFIFLFLTMGTALSLGGIMGMAWSSESFFSSLINSFSRLIPRFSYRLPGAEAGINPNPLGGSILLFLPLAFYLLLSPLDRNEGTFPFKIQKGLFLFSLFSLYLMITALFLTQSVGSWLGLFLTILVLLFFRGSWKRRAIVTAFLIILIFILSHSWNSFKKVSVLNDFFHQKMATRLSFWNLGLQIIKSHPVTGIGMNTVRLRPEVGYESAHLHNHLIHTAAEMGLPTLISYLAMLLIAGYLCYKISMEAKEGWMKAAAMGLGAGQLAHFFYGLTDSIPFGAKPGIFFWISLALINALYNLELRSNKIEERENGPEMLLNQTTQ